MIGERNLRAFCRPPQGVPVVFAGVSTYADGDTVCGLFDQSSGIDFGDRGSAGVAAEHPTLTLPFNAFTPMPKSRDTVTLNGTDYKVQQPTAEDDGAFLVYPLMRLA